MGKKDPRVDDYIERSAPFARSILNHLRKVVHTACPEVEETVRWSSPTFLYHGMMCGMASFKSHCTFGFWKGSLVLGDNGRTADAMGNFGRIERISDLPSAKQLSGYVKKAMELNVEGVKVVRRTSPRKPLPVPPDLAAALGKNKKARAAFDAFPPSHQREYVEWVTEAKRDDTRRKRLETAMEMIAEGKPRHWKYQKS